MNKTTIRQFIKLSSGGEKLQLRFSNETGTQPLVIESVIVAKPSGNGSGIDSSSMTNVTFNGNNKIIIPPGSPAISDEINFKTTNLELIAVSFYLPQQTGLSIVHPTGEQTAWIVYDENATDLAIFPKPTTSTMRFYLTRVDVMSKKNKGATIVTLGDSITDGYGSGVDLNKRWPDVLAQRLIASNKESIGVVNSGIAGNRIIHNLPSGQNGPSALSRLDRDVLSVSGVQWVVIMQGINDIGHPKFDGLNHQTVSAQQIIDGLNQLITRIQSKGIKAYCATLTPFHGNSLNFYSEEGDIKRQIINQWIRTSNRCDAVLDFDAILRDESDLTKLKSEYDSGDGLHPNANGLKAIAESINLSLFQ